MEKVAILSLSADRQISGRVNNMVTVYSIARKYKYDMTLIAQALHVLMDFKPDVVLSCAFFEHFVLRLAALLYRGSIKFILSFHTTEPFDAKERHWNKIYCAMARLFNDRYIAIHSSQKSYYSTEYGLPDDRFTLIHNGVDTTYFAPLGKGSAHGNGFLRIVHVASLKPLKDQTTLFRSIIEFDKYHNEWELTVVGTDEFGMLNQYREYLEEHNVASKVRFLGFVNDVRNILKDADVFILTSLTEALPLSVIEAIAVGLPCIVTAVGGSPDIIENGKEGYLVKPGDYKSIAQHLKYIVDHPDQRRQMGLAARVKAVAKFDFNIMVDKYIKLLESITCT
jgi:glycosyltransferase involved in cell wall biosynthesis